MRTSGSVQHTRDLGVDDHVCWAYDDPAEFADEAAAFLREGLARDLQVWFVAPDEPEAMPAEFDDARDSGAAQVIPLRRRYPTGTVVDPREQAEMYAKATREALADGYRGLRVAAECTSLVETPVQLAAFAGYEHAVDRYIATGAPFSAMCAYRRPVLGDDVVAQVGCMHPMGNDAVAPGFRLHGSAGYDVGLSGEVDYAVRERFAQALERTDPTGDGELLVDATGLQFLDHHALLLLAEQARRHGSTLTLRTSWPGAARLVELMDLPDVRVVA